MKKKNNRIYGEEERSWAKTKKKEDENCKRRSFPIRNRWIPKKKICKKHMLRRAKRIVISSKNERERYRERGGRGLRIFCCYCLIQTIPILLASQMPSTLTNTCPRYSYVKHSIFYNYMLGKIKSRCLA